MMHRTIRFLGAALLAGAASTVALAQIAPNMDIRVGLWEASITLNIDMAGMMSSMDTSKMTPEQKARMEATMKAMAQPHTSTDKKCITKEEMARTFLPEPEEGCKDTIVSNTKSEFDVRRVCTGEHKEDTQVHMQAASREAVSGTMKSTVTESGRTNQMNATITAKWLAAECGDVK